MPLIALNGIELHHERQGEGPPLVLVAGLASDSASWAPLRPGLAARFDLILPDNRCAGRTRPMPCPTGRELMLADLLALLDALALPRVHLLGHSLGGLLALHLAARHPARVASVIAMGTTGRVTAARAAALAGLGAVYGAAGVADETFFRLLYPWLFGPGFFERPETVAEAARASVAYPHRQPPEGYRAQVAALAEFREAAPVAAISCPVLAVTGALDLVAPPAEVAAAFAGRELAVIPGAAHALHWEAPEAVLAAVTGFLARVTASG